MNKITDKDEAALEDMIDRGGLQQVLATIADICTQKAINLRNERSPLAETWSNAGTAVMNLGDSKEVQDVSP